jgi:hypothetical protein
MKNSVFEVDVKGLRELQAGKPIWFVVRELLQNAFDEDITRCTISFTHERGKAYITVVDDSPEGFADLSDAYTLFKSTKKRRNSKVRGRFNLGEKQVLCLCESATIITTTGGIHFDADGRHTLRKKSDKGSSVSIVIKMSKEDYQSCITYCNSIFVPESIVFEVKVDGDTRVINFVQPYKKFETKLMTELSIDGDFKRTMKETLVHLHKANDKAYIYEMGIPVCEIDCAYNVDVQQKIPLNTDRDNVDHKFLKTLYAEVLNNTYEEIEKDNSSDNWVRLATQSDRIVVEAVSDIFNKRYGDKAVIANPFDKKSIDSAITSGYRVIYSQELNGEELKRSKEFGVLKTSSEMFPVTYVDYENVVPNKDQLKVAKLAHKIFTDLMGLSPKLKVLFISSEATVLADFNVNDLTLRFNMFRLSKHDFDLIEVKEMLVAKKEIVDLIIHELAHFYGTHYEKSYLDAITKLGSLIYMKALENPTWFNLKNV